MSALPDAERREPIDLDQVRETAWAIVGAVLYLVGTIAGAYLLAQAFAGWVGAVLILVAGALPSGYTLRKSAERNAAREGREAFAGTRESSSPAVPVPRLP